MKDKNIIIKILTWYKERWLKVLFLMFLTFLTLLVFGYILVVNSHSEMKGIYITLPFVPLLFIFRKDVFLNVEYSLIFYFFLGSFILYLYELIKIRMRNRR